MLLIHLIRQKSNTIPIFKKCKQVLSFLMLKKQDLRSLQKHFFPQTLESGNVFSFSKYEFSVAEVNYFQDTKVINLTDLSGKEIL